MTNEKVIELAEQAGFMLDDAPIIQPYLIQAQHYKIDDELKRFARLVRNETLEEAARACDGWLHADGDTCADAIRSLKK